MSSHTLGRRILKIINNYHPVVIFGSSLSSSSSMDDTIDGDDDVAPNFAQPAPRRRGPGRAIPLAILGPLTLFVVFSSTCGTAFWQNVFHDEGVAQSHPDTKHIVRAVVLAQWSLETVTETLRDTCINFALLRQHAKRGSYRRHNHVGHLTWRIFGICRIQ